MSNRFNVVLPALEHQGLFPVLQNKWINFDDIEFSRFGSRTGFYPFHCFVDDWRLESIWRDPAKKVVDALLSRYVIAPDFSVYHDYPYVYALYQVWRSRVVAAWWLQHGVYVVPVLQWTNSKDPNLADFFYGLAGCEVVAVRCPSRDSGVLDDFYRCAERFLSLYDPRLVLHFGLKRGSDVWPRCQVLPLNSRA